MRLRPTDPIEWRIDRALESLGVVPVGLTMPDKVDVRDSRPPHDNDPLIAIGTPATSNTTLSATRAIA